MGIKWIVGENAFLREKALQDLKDFVRIWEGSTLVKTLVKPKKQKEVVRWLCRPGLDVEVMVIEDTIGLKHWETFGKDVKALLNGSGVELAIITKEPLYDVKGKFYTGIKKASDDIEKCPAIKPWDLHPLEYIQERCKKHKFEIGNEVAWSLFACTGTDPFRIESELIKLRYLEDKTLANEALWYCPGRDIDIGALVRGNVERFYETCNEANVWELFWRIVSYLMRLLEYHDKLDEFGTLKGKVRGGGYYKYEAECRMLSRERIHSGLCRLSSAIPSLKEVGAISVLFATIYDWVGNG
jgi:hypothetical protein